MGKRIYSINDRYFNTWSDNMAYLLGFITADGSVSNNTLSIEIQKRDFEILNFFKQELCANNPIKETKKSKYCRLRFNSKILIDSLSKYEIVPNKTKTLVGNFEIPDGYFGSYLRGFFDGDGWVCCRKNSIEIGFVCYKQDFLCKLKQQADRISTKSLGQIRLKSKINSQYYVWDIYSNSAIKIRDLMFKSNGFSLSRKKNKLFSEFYIPSPRWWTSEQLQYLKYNFKPNTNGLLDELSVALGKSKKSISKKIWELGLINEQNKNSSRSRTTSY